MQSIDKEEMTTEQIREELIEMLCCLTKICDRKGLRYFLAGGTLLGAVRHHGFIPWDDDIDIFMPRPDFDCFASVFKNECSISEYCLIGLQTGEDSWPFLKLINTRIEVKEEFNEKDRYLWIDVFPIDGLPDDSKVAEAHLRRIRRLKRLYALSIAKLGRGKTRFRSCIKFPGILFMRIYGSKKLAVKMDRLARKYTFEKSKYVGNAVWNIGSGEWISKKVFADSTEVLFEGKRYHAPIGKERYLSSVYGDYLSLPSEEKRKPNHSMHVYRLG